MGGVSYFSLVGIGGVGKINCMTRHVSIDW